jgi:hypothetical protein
VFLSMPDYTHGRSRKQRLPRRKKEGFTAEVAERTENSFLYDNGALISANSVFIPAFSFLQRQEDWVSSRRARVAKIPAPAYIKPSKLNPANRLMRCATQPSEKLMISCSTVVTMAMAD